MFRKILPMLLCFVLFCGGSALAEQDLEGRGADEWLAASERQIHLERYANAISCATNAIIINPKLDRAFFLRGVSYTHLGVYHQAIREFAEAIRLNPSNGQYYAWRAEALVESRIYDEAIADLDKAVSMNPNLAVVYQKRGYVYLLTEKHAEAIADFDRALSLNAKDYWSYYQRAGSCYALGRKQEALNNYRSFLECAPDYLKQSYRDFAQARIKELEGN
ncbi:MAG: tetratricopeptide repeat protein [Acidaminococcales bacterium]|jgi:tetratricopeptide (TPR) repeat protein|nr:tetratricopeptide repeat protein [Acidaminococcales bacterium]